jgi:hypothetical protein
MKKGIHKTPPPMPTADANEAMITPAGNARSAIPVMSDYLLNKG